MIDPTDAPFPDPRVLRTLTADELEEIRSLEGIDSADKVASDFTLEPVRVRGIWDHDPDCN